MKSEILLRLFIREAKNNMTEAPVAGLLLPYILSNPPGVEQYDLDSEVQRAWQKRAAEGFTGKKFSLKYLGDPDYVVFADSSKLNKSIIKRYSQSSATDQQLLALKGAEYIYIPENAENPTVETVLSPTHPGWSIYSALQQDFKFAVDNAKTNRPRYYGTREDPNKIVKDFFIIDRDIDNFLPPSEVSTEAGLKKLTSFGCVLSVPEIVLYVKRHIYSDPTNVEFAMAAACCYDYSTNNIKAALIIAGAGVVIGGIAGGPAGAWKGLTVSLTTSDVLLRSVVLWWAWKNDKMPFFYANLALFVINVLFAYSDLAGWSTKAAQWFAGKHIAYAAGVVSDARALQIAGSILEQQTKMAEFFADLVVAHGTLGGLYNLIGQFLIQYIPVNMAEMARQADMATLVEYLKDPNKITRDLTDSERVFAEVIDKYPRY